MGSRDHLSVDWRDVARAVPGGVGIQRGGNLAYVSPTFAEMVGMEPEDLEGQPWEVPFEPRTIADVWAGLETARTDGCWQGEVSTSGSDGGRVELTLSSGNTNDVVVWSLTGSGSTGETERANPEELLLGEPSRLMRTVLSTVDDVVYVIGDDGRFWFWNERLAETTGYSYERIGEMKPKEFIPTDQHEYVPGLMQAVESIENRRVRVDILTADGERIPHEFSGTTFEDPATGRSFRCGIARDISERLERERKIRRQRDELATLNRINALLFETTQEAIRTGDKGPIMRVLCEQAVESDLYRCAWVGQRERGTDRLTRVAAEGVPDTLEAIQIDGAADGDEHGILERAVLADEPGVSICRTPSAQEWWSLAGGDGVESLAVVPLDHGDVVYGCLVLGTERPNAFPGRERTALEVLGHLLGTVLHAARAQKLVFAAAVVELEFEATDGEPPPLFLGPSLDGRLSLEGAVPGSEGWVLYLSVEGVAPSSAADAIRSPAAVERTRVVTEGDRSGRLEVFLRSSTLLDVVTGAGGTLQEATVGPDGTRFVVDAPVDADISAVVDHITEEFPEVDLLATRERDRQPAMRTQPSSILDELTTRQLDVLEAAYRAGYFDWPRESTAEEVADALGLARPTVHAHLRKAERRILSALLETTRR